MSRDRDDRPCGCGDPECEGCEAGLTAAEVEFEKQTRRFEADYQEGRR